MTDDSLLELSEQDYLKMEEALSQTSRGRSFLRMRDRRTRLVAVDEFHHVAKLLEQQVRRLGSGDFAPARPAAPAGDGQLARVQEELNALRAFVDQARGDMAALRPAESGSDPILTATAELDAIVQSTERATTEILDATDIVQEFTARIPRDDPDWAELANGIETQCIEIMTACSFQDITGQRTSKVINTLRFIEERVNALIEVWGVQRPGAPMPDVAAAHRKLNDSRPDAHLLNGPQLDGQGVSQNDIDALFDGMATANPQVLTRAETIPDEPAAAPPPPPPPPPPPKPKSAAKKPPPPPPPPPPPAAEPAGGGAPISQDDIDALFA